jgi:hypothetical protein
LRKNYKIKRRSCALCKPHKMGWSKRWSIRELVGLRRAEKDIREGKFE